MEGVSVDPDPDWSFDALLSELSAVEKKLLTHSSPFLAAPFSERRSRYSSTCLLYMRLLELSV